MGRDDPAGGSNLPAPYRNPWGSLAEALAAVAADSRLRLRELWRRNGEGDLRCPGWWPRDLAPLFWPLLLAAALALVVAAFGLALPKISAPSSATSATSGLSGPSVAEAPSASPSVDRLPEPAAEPLPEPVAGPATEPATEPEASVEPESASEPEPVPLDPLAELLERPGADGLLRRAEGQPQRGTLLLQVRPAFNRLQRPEQQRLAELWQGWASELGYDHLELRDGLGGLLARDALVGSGMIVLSSQPA